MLVGLQLCMQTMGSGGSEGTESITFFFLLIISSASMVYVFQSQCHLCVYSCVIQLYTQLLYTCRNYLQMCLIRVKINLLYNNNLL